MKFSNTKRINTSKKTAASFRNGVGSVFSIYPARSIGDIGSFQTDKGNLKNDMHAIGRDFQISIKRIVHG